MIAEEIDSWYFSPNIDKNGEFDEATKKCGEKRGEYSVWCCVEHVPSGDARVIRWNTEIIFHIATSV